MTSKPEQQPESPEPDDARLDPRTSYPPPVDFRILIGSFAAQAMASLGKLPNPLTGKSEVNLPWARYFIDLLAMLEKKTKGNLEPAEASELQSSLSMLRLTYVDTSKAADAADATPPDDAATESS